MPLAWARTQNNLGGALQALGERESGPARLEEAVAAFRAALEERTRARVPLDWAATQNNLGLALATLGERESDIEYLKQALVAIQGAFEVYHGSGMVQYDEYFQNLVQDIEILIENHG